MNVMHIPSIRLELVSECRGSDCRPPSRPPRIHSIVRVPEPGEVSRMLSLPEVGVLLGDLALPNGDVVEGNEVRLPLGALLHHVLVVGTTGSGKTTLLKSLAFNLVSQVDVTQGKVTVIALDTVGYYHHLFMNGVSVRVLLPITRDKLRVYLSRCKDERNDEKSLVRCLARSIAEDYVQNVIKNFDIDVKVKGKSYVYAIRRDSHAVRIKRIVLTVPDTGSTIVLIPWALRTRDVLYKVHDITGMLTDQARMFYRRVIEKVKERIGGELTFKRIFEYLTQRSEVPSSRGRSSMVYDVIGDELGIHSGTMENIVRTILAVDESGMVDVENCNIRIMEPDYREVFAPGHVVVHLVDATPIVQRIVVYRVLERIYEFMGPEHLKDKDRIAVILIDEAHLFFPQARSEDEKSMIEAHLTRLTRLGRGRGIAVVFATHMPSDLNDAVLQLTNTKIILRSDEKVLETLDVPSNERRFLTTAATGLAFINSFAYKYPIYVKVRMTAYHVS